MKVLLFLKKRKHSGKRRNARFKEFVPLSQCFQKWSAAESSKSICMWERVKETKYLRKKIVISGKLKITVLKKIENIVGKGECTCFEQFLLY